MTPSPKRARNEKTLRKCVLHVLPQKATTKGMLKEADPGETDRLEIERSDDDVDEIEIEVVEEEENAETRFDPFPHVSCPRRTDPPAQDFLEKVKDEKSALQYTFELNLLPDPQVHAVKFAKVLKEKANGPKSRKSRYFSVGFCGRTLKSGLICPGIMRGPKCEGNLYVYQCGCSTCRTTFSVKNGIAAFGADGKSKSKGKTFFLEHAAGANYPLRVIFKLMWSFIHAKSFPETRKFCADDQMFKLPDESLIDWFAVFRGILLDTFKNAPKIGGTGETVYMDMAFLPCGYRDPSTEDRLMIRDAKLGCTDKDHCQSGPWIIGMLAHKYKGKPELRCFTTDSLDASLGTFLVQNTAHDTEIVCMDEKLYLMVQEQCHFSGNVQYSVSDQSESWISSVYGTVRRTVTRVQFDEWVAFYWWRSLHKNALFTDFCAEIAKMYPV